MAKCIGSSREAPSENNLTCVKRCGRLASPSVSRTRQATGSRGLTRVIPLTVVSNPSTRRILTYAGVVSAFFSLRYRLDKIPCQSVSQSVVGWLVTCLLACCFTRSVGFVSFVMPSSVVALSISPYVCRNRSPASIDRLLCIRIVRCVNREKRERGGALLLSMYAS